MLGSKNDTWQGGVVLGSKIDARRSGMGGSSFHMASSISLKS